MAAEFVTAIKRNQMPAGGLTAIDLNGTRVAVPTSATRITRLTTHARMSSAHLQKATSPERRSPCMCHGAEFDFRPAPEADHPHPPTPPWLARVGGRVGPPGGDFVVYTLTGQQRDDRRGVRPYLSP